MRVWPGGIRGGGSAQRKLYSIFFSLLFLTVCPSMAGFKAVNDACATSSVNVPVGHWSYDVLEKLGGYGLLHSDIQGMRPFTRMEMARLVHEAATEAAFSEKKLPPLIVHLLEKLKLEFRQELSAYNPNGSVLPETFIKPVNELEARYVYVDGKPHEFGPIPGNRPGHVFDIIRASEGTPLVYNNNGVVYGEHNNLTVQFSSSLRLFDFFSGYVEPIFMVRQNSGNLPNFEETDVDLLKGYGKISKWNIELEAGRDTLWWGQGYNGTLLLTNNAWPLDMLKLSNPVPSLLPWYFSYLGLTKYTIFVARLEDDRVDFAHPLLGGMRIQFKPFPIFEFGAATTFLFDGEGAPQLSFQDFLGMVGFFKGSISNKKADQLASIDFRLRLPFLWNAELYGEYGGEDSGSSDIRELMFRELGEIIGIYFPRLTCDAKADLRLEFASNADWIHQVHSFWYGNSLYRAGYTHDGLIMGHHMGGDASEFFARSTYYVTPDILVGLDYSYIERGETNKFPGQAIETTNAVGTDLAYDFSDKLCFSLRYSCGVVTNFDLTRGDDRIDNLLMATVRWRF